MPTETGSNGHADPWFRPHSDRAIDRRTMTARRTAIASIAAHKLGPTQDYTEHAGEEIYGQYVFHEVAQRQYLATPIFHRIPPDGNELASGSP